VSLILNQKNGDFFHGFRTQNSVKKTTLFFFVFLSKNAPYSIWTTSSFDTNSEKTSIHPANRAAVWQLETWNDEVMGVIRTYVENLDPSKYVQGGGYNHGHKAEPNWRTTYWGDANYEKLLKIKEKYDPKNLFNCWHCVGYEPTCVAKQEKATTTFISENSKYSVTKTGGYTKTAPKISRCFYNWKRFFGFFGPFQGVF